MPYTHKVCVVFFLETVNIVQKKTKINNPEEGTNC